MYIKVNDPTLNRNVGKSEIPDIYDNVLKSKGGLQLKDSFHKRIPPITIRRHYDTAINQSGVTIRASYVVDNSSN